VQRRLPDVRRAMDMYQQQQQQLAAAAQDQ